MEDRGFFIIDGSRLFASIHELRRTRAEFAEKKLNISNLTESLQRTWSLNVGPTVRVIYYFKQNDPRIQSMLEVPDVNDPGKKDHWQIKECGESIDAVPDIELEKLSPQYRDHFARSEKGLDGKLICDVLLHVAAGRASNIVFLVNDRDYIPLFEAVQYLGGNVYLTALDSTQKIQKRLTQLADKYLTLDSDLPYIFGNTAPSKQENILQQDPQETLVLAPDELEKKQSDQIIT